MPSGKLYDKTKQHLETHYNLHGKDVAVVLTAFAFCKYIVFIGFFPLCHKFQPIRRFLVYTDSSMRGRVVSAYRRQVLKFNRLKEGRNKNSKVENGHENTNDIHHKNSLKNKNGHESINHRSNRQLSMYFGTWRKNQLYKWKQRQDRFSQNDSIISLRKRYIEYQNRFKTKAMKRRILLSKWKSRLQDRAQVNRSWIQEKFAILIQKVEKNESWHRIGKVLSIRPKDLALTVAESFILYKITWVLHAPFTFFVVAKAYVLMFKQGE